MGYATFLFRSAAQAAYEIAERADLAGAIASYAKAQAQSDAKRLRGRWRPSRGLRVGRSRTRPAGGELP